MKIRSWLVCMGIAASVVACGEDDEDKAAAQPASVNEQVATQSVQDAITALASVSTASGGPSSASALATVAQSSQNLLQAKQPGTTPSSVASGLTIEDGIAPLDLDSPGCTCTETSCTFSNCSPSTGSSQFSFTIDGSYSWGGGRVQCNDLKYTFGGSNSGTPGANIGFSTKVVVTINCDITVTETMIKGFIQSAGSSSTEIAGQNTQGAYSSEWNVKTTYADVTFNDSKQPTGGSVKVEGTTSVTAGGQTQSYAGSAEIRFPIR